MTKYRVAPTLEVARLTKILHSVQRFLDHGVNEPGVSSSVVRQLLEILMQDVNEYMELDNKERYDYFNFIKRRIKRHGEGN